MNTPVPPPQAPPPPLNGKIIVRLTLAGLVLGAWFSHAPAYLATNDSVEMAYKAVGAAATGVIGLILGTLLALLRKRMATRRGPPPRE